MNLKKRVEKLEKIYQTDMLIIEEIYDEDFSAFAE